ncbi:MAG TPA: tetratricopeptide repeat protein [Acidobacteriaceae bacterium]|jgi:tetratricopeptide (TPR) repeat protein|nr:tetratricopeptide repeat protein [Acidobacteriaceae bacterium]
MTTRRALLLTPLLALAFVEPASPSGGSMQAAEDGAPHLSAAASLGLPAPRVAELQQAIDAHNYPTAEEILLAEINRDPRSASAGRMLAFAGTVYFLNHDYLNAAIAWKKSDAIAPLAPSLHFSLAMTYIRMAHSDWARPEIESLAQHYPRNPLFPYWLGRVDYDAHQYDAAIGHFQEAIKLDPAMARAYDNLGLCYYYENQNAQAIESYNKAIELDRGSQHPSAWPYLNLAITQQFLGQPANAQANLQEALRLDPSFAQAHFQLGTVLEDLDQLNNAVVELREAARLNPAYPEPHLVLARIYHRLGQQQAAQDEAEAYKRLHPPAATP